MDLHIDFTRKTLDLHRNPAIKRHSVNTHRHGAQNRISNQLVAQSLPGASLILPISLLLQIVYSFQA